MARNTELKDRATRAFRDLMASKQPAREIQRAILGDGSGNIRVTDRPDLVYVRLKAKGDALWKVLNDKVTDVENLPVLIEKRPVGDIWEVIDVDKSGLLYTGSGWESVTYTPNHASQHEWPDYAPGADPVNVYPRAVVPLRCYATYQNGLLVDVAPLRYSYAGQLKRFDGTTMDVSGYQPSAGQQRNILTYLDPTDNVMKVVAGGATTYSATIVPPLPSIPDYAIPSAVIRLWERNYITEQDVTDYRLLLDKVVPGGSGTLSDFDLTDAVDDQVLTYQNEAWRNKSLYDAKIASYTPGFVVTTYSGDLPNERLLKSIPGGGLQSVDAGANAEFELGLDFSTLPSTTTYSGTDEVAILQSGVHRRIPATNLIPVGGAGGGGAPTDAQYLVLSYDATLSDERLFKAEPEGGLKLTDAGAGAEAEMGLDFSTLLTGTPTPADVLAVLQGGVHKQMDRKTFFDQEGYPFTETTVDLESEYADYNLLDTVLGELQEGTFPTEAAAIHMGKGTHYIRSYEMDGASNLFSSTHPDYVRITSYEFQFPNDGRSFATGMFVNQGGGLETSIANVTIQTGTDNPNVTYAAAIYNKPSSTLAIQNVRTWALAFGNLLSPDPHAHAICVYNSGNRMEIMGGRFYSASFSGRETAIHTEAGSTTILHGDPLFYGVYSFLNGRDIAGDVLTGDGEVYGTFIDAYNGDQYWVGGTKDTLVKLNYYTGATDTTVTSLANQDVMLYSAASAKWENVPMNIAQLGDVSLSGVADSEILTYDTGTGAWINSSAPAAADAQYLVLSYDAGLANERLLKPTPGEGLKGTDAGAGAEYELGLDFTNLPAITTYSATDELAIVQSGVHRRIPTNQIIPEPYAGWKPGNMVVVSSSGKGDYTTMADALASVTSGTILVDSGIYTCDNLTLTAGVDIRGVNQEMTTIRTLSNNTCLTAGGANTISNLTIYASLNSASTVTALDISNSAVKLYDVKTEAINTGSGDAYAIDMSAGSSACRFFNSEGVANVVGAGTAYALYVDGGGGDVIGGQYTSTTGYGIYFNNPAATVELHLPKANGSDGDVAIVGGTAPEGWYTDGANQIVGISDGVLTADELAAKPSNPPANSWSIYPKSDGWYVLDDAGTETGPLGSGGGDDTLTWLTGAL